jgi:hypothetical protein
LAENIAKAVANAARVIVRGQASHDFAVDGSEHEADRRPGTTARRAARNASPATVISNQSRAVGSPPEFVVPVVVRNGVNQRWQSGLERLVG